MGQCTEQCDRVYGAGRGGYLYQRGGKKRGHISLRKGIGLGPGFSTEALNYATEEFYRGDESRHDRSHQGLGLSITKRFVEAQGGFLEIRNSEAGGGKSRFG